MMNNVKTAACLSAGRPGNHRAGPERMIPIQKWAELHTVKTYATGALRQNEIVLTIAKQNWAQQKDIVLQCQ